MSLPEHTIQKQLATNIAMNDQLYEDGTLFIIAEAPTIHSSNPGSVDAVYMQEYLGDRAFPVGSSSSVKGDNGIADSPVTSGIVVLPTEGGGRGPATAGGVDISPEFILGLISGRIDESSMTPTYNQQIIYLNNSIIQHTQRISILEQKATQSETSIIGLLDDVAILETLVNSHTTALTTIIPKVDLNTYHVDNLNVSVGDLVTRVTNNEALLQSQGGQITAVIGKANFNASEIVSLDNVVMILADQVNLSNSKVDNMELSVANNTTLLIEHSENLQEINIALGTSGKATNKDERGFVGNDETIVLLTEYKYGPPIISLIYSHGVTAVNPITTNQEILYGHSGVTLTANDYEYEFTVKAAILEYAAPSIVPIAWQPPEVIVGDPAGSSVVTDTSPEYSTVAACMGLRVKGTIGIVNIIEAGISGTMNIQIAIDTDLAAGDPPVWVTISELYVMSLEADSLWVEKNFDIQLVLDQADHTYIFRGLFVSELVGAVTRELTGAVHIATVIESGTGAILSNDLQIKWSTKD